MLFELFKFGLFEYGLKRIPAYFRKFLKMQIVILVNVVRGIVYLFDIFLCRPLKWLCVYFGKRGELRYREILPAPKPSSLSKVLMYLSSPLLLVLNKWRKVFSSSLLCLSNISSLSNLARVFMDPRNKSEDDERVCVFEDDCYKKNEAEDDQRERWLEDDFTLKSSLQADRRSQAIYELEKRGLIGGSLDDCCRNRGMTIKKYALQKIGMTISLFFMFLIPFLLVSNSSHAAVCFLPDCQLETKRMEFIPNGAYECLAKGFKSYTELECSEYTIIEECPENDYYIKCDGTEWCLSNGYDKSNCEVPEYLDEKCPNGEELYQYCTEDVKRACSELNPEYVAECEDGWKRDDDAVCLYSDDYAKCCNLCEEYDYLAEDIGTGYVQGESCLSCGEITKYKRILDPCIGYQSCSNGGKDGSATCMHGTETWYAECCDSSYQYSCSGNGYVKGSGISCSGRYTGCICAMQYEWEDGECSYCGDSYKYECTGTGYVGGNGAACGSMYESCICADGYEWDGVSGTCKACDTSCSVGNIMYSDGTCNACLLSDKTAIGVVVKDNELITSVKITTKKWASSSSNNVGGIIDTNSPFDGYIGKENTTAIMLAYPNDTVSNNAAVYCNSYSTAGTNAGDWYLPAMRELYDYLYVNYRRVKSIWSKLGITVSNTKFWSSSEWGTSSGWNLQFSDGSDWNDSKTKYASVSCFASIQVDNGKAKICDSSYKYTCKGDKYIKGAGLSCGGYYKSCECAVGNGYEQNGVTGDCCDTLCRVGNIMYDDGTCNSCVVSGKTAIGVVIKDYELVVSSVIPSMQWSITQDDIPAIPNLSTHSMTPRGVIASDKAGIAHTAAIVDYYGENANENQYAGVYCYNYAPSGMSETKGNWYLPAIGELLYIRDQFDLIKFAWDKIGTTFSKYFFWNSTESSSSSVHSITFPGISVTYSSKTNSYPVGCFMPIDIKDENCGSHKYSCKGENFSGGIGDTCGGWYTECSCKEGYLWSGENGQCCDTRCIIGHILYSDGTCSSCKMNDKTIVGVVVKNNALVMSKEKINVKWSSSSKDISSLVNYTSETDALFDYNGKANTKAIVAAYPSDTISNNAAVYCNSYSTAGTKSGDWYLPAAGEVSYYMEYNSAKLKNLYTEKLGWDDWYTGISTSTEYNNANKWYVGLDNGSLYTSSKTSNGSIVCFLPIVVDDNNQVLLNDSDYQYACSKTEQVDGGLGADRGGYYAACKCAEGYKWDGGRCVEGYDCSVGMIYYSDGSCSSVYDSSKTAIGIVVKDNALIVSQIDIEADMFWASNSVTDVKEVTNYASAMEARTDYAGKNNTEAIVATYTDDTISDNVAVYCNKYSTAGTSAGDWYLPAAGEAYDYLYNNVGMIYSAAYILGWNWEEFGYISWGGGIWTSSEGTIDCVWGMNIETGSMSCSTKNILNGPKNPAACFLDISGR